MEPKTQLYVLCCQLAGELFLRKVRTVVGKVGGMPTFRAEKKSIMSSTSV